MNLLWANLIGGGLVSVGIWSYLWLTRDRNLAELAPELELKRYLYLTLWITVYVFAIYFTGSFFAEQDAAWHQTIVRDTVFTPSHVVLFYGTIPLYIAIGVGSFLYAMTPAALVRKGYLSSVCHRRDRTIPDPSQPGIQRVGPCVLYNGRALLGSRSLGICGLRMVGAGSGRSSVPNCVSHDGSDPRSVRYTRRADLDSFGSAIDATDNHLRRGNHSRGGGAGPDAGESPGYANRRRGHAQLLARGQ